MKRLEIDSYNWEYLIDSVNKLPQTTSDLSGYKFNFEITTRTMVVPYIKRVRLEINGRWEVLNHSTPIIKITKKYIWLQIAIVNNMDVSFKQVKIENKNYPVAYLVRNDHGTIFLDNIKNISNYTHYLESANVLISYDEDKENKRFRVAKLDTKLHNIGGVDYTVTVYAPITSELLIKFQDAVLRNLQDY